MALFAKDGTRFRFATDYQFSTQQVTPNLRRVSFVYKPETPAEIIGQPINLLSRMEKFAVNYSDFFKTIGFDTWNRPTKLHLKVLVNGIEVFNLPGQVAAARVLESGQAVMDVTQAFDAIPDTYARRWRDGVSPHGK